MLKILGAPHSRAFRVIWLANELGIPYEHIPVTFSVPNAQCKEPWYLALNPNGLVPAIDDGGFVMWETAAINLYLAETYKNSLYPSTPQSRGRMLQWTFFATTEVEPALITLFRNRIFFPPDQTPSRRPHRKAGFPSAFGRTSRRASTGNCANRSTGSFVRSAPAPCRPGFPR
jgi:glutathione S-transferase